MARAISWVCALTGLTLLAAAGLKGWELFGGSPSTGQSFPRWIQITGAEFEAILGVWLLSGWRAVWSRRVALGAFLVFLLVAAVKVVRGEETCGCMGAVHIRPEWMALFDFGALIAIWLWRPEPERAQAARSGTLLGPTTSLLAGNRSRGEGDRRTVIREYSLVFRGFHGTGSFAGKQYSSRPTVRSSG